MPPRGRPLLVVVSLVASSSVASLSSASSCDGAAASKIKISISSLENFFLPSPSSQDWESLNRRLPLMSYSGLRESCALRRVAESLSGKCWVSARASVPALPDPSRLPCGVRTAVRPAERSEIIFIPRAFYKLSRLHRLVEINKIKETSPGQMGDVRRTNPKRKKENGQPKGGMGGRHAATTQGF